MAFDGAIGFFLKVQCKGHLIQLFLTKAQLRQDGPAIYSDGSQKSSMLGNFTTSPGKLFQWLIVLFVKNFPHVSNWNLLRSNLYPIPLVFSM